MLAWSFILGISGAVLLYFHIKQIMHYLLMMTKYQIKDMPTPQQSAEEFLHFVESYKNLSPTLYEDLKTYKDKFVFESTTSYLQGTLKGAEFLRGLRQNADAHYENEVQNARNIVIASKMLPVVGWFAAIASTVWLLNVETGTMSYENVVTAFSVLMAAVTYGLVLSYFLMQPLVNRILGVARRNRLRHAMVIEGFGQLMKEKSTYEIRETLALVVPKYNVDKSNWVEHFPENIQEIA